MDTTALKQIFDLIVWAVIAIIAGGGLIFGIYSLWDGFTNDQPESKKKGIIILIVTVVALAVLITAKVIIWNMITANIPS